MKISSTKDKRLKALVEGAQIAKGFNKSQTTKIIDMIAAIRAATTFDKFPANWRPHFLTPSRPNTMSLTVTGNERLTFTVDQDAGEVSDLDYEDYH